jgi:pyoverdine/dityrosine biosynthesis protein Dit1
VRLLPSSDIWRTPWHAVTLFDGNHYSLVRREEAEALRAKGTLARNKYPFFVLEEAS